MIFSLYAKIAAAAVIATALAGSHWRAYTAGEASVQADWNKDITVRALAAVAASEAARAKEQVLQTKVTKVANDYYAEKKRRAADALAAAGQLRDLEAALVGAASANPPATPGADDPRGAIAGECAGALGALDKYAQGLASQTRSLQDWTVNVCLSK